MKAFIYHIFHGTWTWGWESKKTWATKPMFDIMWTYYDGYHFCIHLWWFWLECD